MNTSNIIPVSNNRELFFDDHAIESMEDIYRVWHQPLKHTKPLLTGDRPWERGSAMLLGGGQVDYNPATGLFKMWYRIDFHDHEFDAPEIAHDPMGIGLLGAYAESTCGLHWAKPMLRQRTLMGTSENNLLGVGKHMLRRANVIRDEHDPDESRRYKMLYVDIVDIQNPLYMTDTDKFALFSAYSPDGIHWQQAATPPWSRRHHGGSCEHHPNIMGRDPATGKFVLYPRTFVDRDPAVYYRDNLRAIARAVSDDFETWEYEGVVLEPDDRDPPDVDFPGFVVWPYQGIYIGLIYRFVHSGAWDGSVETELAFSRDGKQWTRCADRSLFLNKGKPGNWDDWVAVPTTPLIVNGCIWLYYGGWNVGHSMSEDDRRRYFGKTFYNKPLGQCIGLANLRIDGFVSLCAGPSTGTILSKPVLADRPMRLEVNARTNRGWLRVELLDQEGRILKQRDANTCDPFFGDELRHTITWDQQSIIAATNLGPIRLRFVLEQSELFSFRLTPL